MRHLLPCILLMFVFLTARAGRITGTVKDQAGTILSFSSIEVKGGRGGTTANSEGRYFLNLSPGNYVITCQHIGYARQERSVTVDTGTVVIDFVLTQQELYLGEVIVKKGEDPAYEIIRNAIRKRPEYNRELKRYMVDVYTKGIFKLRDFPDKVLGQKVDFEDGDTGRRRMIYLSETISRYSVDGPKKSKVEVLATQVSGQSGGFGLASGDFVSFYQNNISLGSGLNARGFISPIADNALNYYRYKYEGAFFEDGHQVSRIAVIPRRKYEPLFSGFIHIVENSWRIHSLQLKLVKESQLEILDTLVIEQMHVPLEQTWVIRNQVLYPAMKMFGFDAHGSFVNIYSSYNLHPVFAPDFFDKTIIRYTDSSNKKKPEFWETARPVALQEEEVADYKKKDSLEQLRRDPKYLDSLDRKSNKISLNDLLLTGETFRNRKKQVSIGIPSLMQSISFNTVEGLVAEVSPTITKRPDSSTMSRKSFSFTPTARYGFSNDHLNAHLAFSYTYGKKYRHALFVAGGKNVFQFNNANPIRENHNTISTLLYRKNHMKIYEAWFLRLMYSQGMGNGFGISARLQYQDRIPLENTTNYSWTKQSGRVFTPNFPVEVTAQNFKRHQVVTAGMSLTWQPGMKYIDFPDRRLSVGSGAPFFSVSYTTTLPGMLSADLDYSKWNFSLSDNLNLRLAGSFAYRMELGGFLHRDSVEVPDYTHFNGNQLLTAAPYMNSFQLAPYYRFSNTARIYAEGHAEHHFNGFITNKIPLFRKLNWHLVGGSNAFYVNENNFYVEAFAGLENILKAVRVDFINGYGPGREKVYTGIRIGINGALLRQ